MRAKNPSPLRPAAIERGRTSPRRSGSRGITFRDSSNEAHPVVDLLVKGATITDTDDGTAVLTIDASNEVTDPDPGTAEVNIETAAGTGMTIDVPADVVDGMFMFMAIWKDDDDVTFPPVVCAGWTQIGSDNGFDYKFRIADSEPPSYDVTYGPGNRRAVGVIIGIPDIDTTNPIASYIYSATGDVGMSLATGTYFLLASTEVNSGAVTFTDPTDWDILAQGETGGAYPNTAHESGVLAGRLFTGSATETPVTFGSNHGNWNAGAVFALRKASPHQELEVAIAALDKAKSEVNVSHLITAEKFPIIAHRGDINPVDGYPEDTLEAHRQAMVRGAHGTEFGVQRDADGTWQVFHDLTVDRTTDGTGTVASKTTAQMAALNVDGGYGYDAGRHGTSLAPATLDQVLDVILPYDPIIMLNPKEVNLDQYAALAQRIADLGLQERVVILSPDAGGGAIAKAIAPRILTDDTMTMDDTDAIVDAAFVQAFEPRALWSYSEVTLHYGDDETAMITDMWTYGVRGHLTNDLPNALLIRNEVVLGITGTGAPSGPAGGDLSGTYPSPSVIDDSHDHTTATAPGGRWEHAVVPGSPPDDLYADGDWLYIFVP